MPFLETKSGQQNVLGTLYPFYSCCQYVLNKSYRWKHSHICRIIYHYLFTSELAIYRTCEIITEIYPPVHQSKWFYFRILAEERDSYFSKLKDIEDELRLIEDQTKNSSLFFGMTSKTFCKRLNKILTEESCKCHKEPCQCRQSCQCHQKCNCH